jgi:hypothetical protein
LVVVFETGLGMGLLVVLPSMIVVLVPHDGVSIIGWMFVTKNHSIYFLMLESLNKAIFKALLLY